MSTQRLYLKAHGSFIHNSQKLEANQMLITGEWINKLRYIHTTDYYSTVKKTDINNRDEPQKTY